MVGEATPHSRVTGRTPTGITLLVTIALAVALLAAACGSSTHSQAATKAAATGGTEASTQTPHNGGTLVVGIGAESDTWNPALAEWAAEGSLVASSVFEPLAKLNSRGGADPYLATSWIADATFDKWELKLRPGVKFQDGEPFDANAVKLNLDTYVNGALTGQVLKPMVKDVEVVDPLTVVVDMTQPWAAFPSSYLDGSGDMMMAPAMINSPDHGAADPIGTGPFTFVSWTPNDTFKVKRNPLYWQKGEPHLDAITFKVITDEATRVAALQTGDINMMLTTSAADANRLASSFTVVKDWDSEPVSVQFNTVASINGTFNPMSNIHARTAVVLATNPKAVAQQAGDGVKTADSPFASTSVWGLPDGKTGSVSFDTSKVKAEVAAYEQETGQKSLSFTLTSPANADYLRLDQQLQAEWKAAGIDAKISTSEQAAMIKQLVGGELQAVVNRLYNYPDPDNDAVFWSSKTIQGVGGININFSLYANPQVDQDLGAGKASGYPAQRKAAYDDLVHQVNTAVTNDWLYFTPYSLIASPNLHGLDTARTVAFGNYEPKTWLGGLWLSSSSS